VSVKSVSVKSLSVRVSLVGSLPFHLSLDFLGSWLLAGGGGGGGGGRGGEALPDVFHGN